MGTLARITAVFY